MTEVGSFGQKQLAVKWNGCHYHVWHFSSVFALNVSQHCRLNLSKKPKNKNIYLFLVFESVQRDSKWVFHLNGKWALVPKFVLNLQIWARKSLHTNLKQQPLVPPDFISLNILQNSDCLSKCILESNFAPGSNQFNLLITFHLHNLYNLYKIMGMNYILLYQCLEFYSSSELSDWRSKRHVKWNQCWCDLKMRMDRKKPIDDMRKKKYKI